MLTDYQRIPLTIKMKNKNIVMEIPKSFEVITLPSADAFIINFSYPNFKPRPVNEAIVNPSARIVISGANKTMRSAADWFLSLPGTIYERTENNIEIYRNPLTKKYFERFYVFKDSHGNKVLFTDMGDMTVGYLYYHTLSSGLEVHGAVSKKVSLPLPEVDADISNFIESLICDRK